MSYYTDICILHTNDTHSYLDDFAKRAYIVKDIRKQNNRKGIKTFLFDSGDLFAGSIYFNLYKGKKEVELMNLLEYDAMTLGNHEFDSGDDLLHVLLRNALFPVISTNVDVSNNVLLKRYALEGDTQVLYPYIHLKLFHDMNIAVLGVTTLSTRQTSSPEPSIVFEDPYSSIIKTVKILKKKENMYIILLSHLGIEEDKKLASKLNEIDIIIGGHSHTLTKEPIFINHTYIVQAGEYGNHLGELYVRLYSNGTCKIKSSKIIEIKKVDKEDKSIRKIIDSMQVDKFHLCSRLIGHTHCLLDGSREKLYLGETNLTKLITDSFLHKARKKGYSVDASIINSGGVRSSINTGPIFFRDLIRVLPFSKKILVLRIKGQDLMSALKTGLYPQVSNMKLVYDGDRKENNMREIWIYKNGRYVPISKEDYYTIVTNSFVSSEKDYYIGFKKAEILDHNIGLDVDVLSEYIVALNSI